MQQFLPLMGFVTSRVNDHGMSLLIREHHRIFLKSIERE
jgi:hypothetical protein